MEIQRDKELRNSETSYVNTWLCQCISYNVSIDEQYSMWVKTLQTQFSINYYNGFSGWIWETSPIDYKGKLSNLIKTIVLHMGHVRRYISVNKFVLSASLAVFTWTLKIHFKSTSYPSPKKNLMWPDLNEIQIGWCITFCSLIDKNSVKTMVSRECRGTLVKRSLQIWRLRMHTWHLCTQYIWNEQSFIEKLIKRCPCKRSCCALLTYILLWDVCLHCLLTHVKEHLVSSAFPSLPSDTLEIVAL